jgi:cystathionine beta-lyase
MIKTTTIDAGFAVAPEDSYQGLRGLRTLSTRFPRHGESGLAVASWLETREEVARVLHPALPSHAQYELWRRDYAGTGGLFGVELHPMPNSKVESFLNALKLFGLGFSYGGFESLAILSKPTRTASPWTGGPLVRLNVGLEAPEDLIADLTQAFDAMRT